MTTNRKTSLYGSLALLTMIPLAACDSIEEMNEGLVPHSSWRAAERAAPASAEWVRLDHTVAFASGAMMLNTAERQRLAGFLRQSELTATDKISLSAPKTSDGTVDPTDLARVDAVKAELSLLGLNILGDLGERSVGENSIGITVERAVVMVPDCADESEVDGLFKVRPTFEIGCADNHNLGQMVAFPEDLIEGRGLSPADGTKGATAIQRYREDKVKKLKEEETTN